jgi:hypothetical protein
MELGILTLNLLHCFMTYLYYCDLSSFILYALFVIC